MTDSTPGLALATSALVADRPRAIAGWRRTAQRYLLPRFIVSLALYLRDRAMVSTSSRVQLSPLVKFGRGSVVKSFCVVQTSGGAVTFGRDCAISAFNHIAAGPMAGIVAGDYVRTGPHVCIIATTREYRRKDKLIVEQGYRDKGIRIGNDVLIGAGAVLVDGCEIGDGAVIGVGSIVTGKVPPYAVVVGSPAKVVFWRH
jgi:acetyltransferase-like isoleucine patch superfamily enzyme